MADIFRLSALSENTNLQTRYNNMLAGNLPANGVYESIQTVTVGAGGASSIDFTSIPSTYKHLQLRGIARSTLAGSTPDRIIVQLNNDSGLNYAYHVLQGNGAAASSYSNTSNNWFGIEEGNVQTSATANVFASSITDFLDYANTNKYKTIRTLNGADLNGSGIVVMNSGLWMSTNAVTSIKLISPASTNFVQYSSFALYGIKG